MRGYLMTDIRNRLAWGMSAAALAAVAVLLSAVPAAAAPFGTAIEVPGTAALNSGAAVVRSLSCPAPGDCSAGGSYTDNSGDDLPFVVGQTNGTWGIAIEVPGFAALPGAPVSGVVESVSCSSPGNCAAVGHYSTSARFSYAFAVTQTGGTWGRVIVVPGTAAAALLPGEPGSRAAVSCVPGHAGDCAVVGGFDDSSGHYQAFVADQTGGMWGQAVEVPGFAALNAGGWGWADHVSCPAPGGCTLGGSYFNSHHHPVPFVAREQNGTWGTARAVRGITALGIGGYAGSVGGLSCTSPGNCSAAGLYGAHPEVYVTTEKNGIWSAAEPMPGLAALARVGSDVFSLSCTSAGNCAAGGYYFDAQHHSQAFVISQSGGTWGQALQVPGSAALNKGDASVYSVSCASAGNCVAGGYYASPKAQHDAFTASENGGKWQQMRQVPGTPALSTGDYAQVMTVGCARAGTCSVGGFYKDGTGHIQAFVDSQS